MTSFSKSAASAGVVPAIDLPFQFLGLVVSGVLATIAVSSTLTSAAPPIFFPGVPESLISALRDLVHSHQATFSLGVHGPLLLWQWLALFAPVCVSLVLFHLALPGLHRNVRRLAAFALAGLYIFVCLGALKASNPAWAVADGTGMLALVPRGSLTLFRFLKAALFTLAMLGLCVPFVLQGGRDASRALRLTGVVAVFLAWLAWDWHASRTARDVGEAALSAGARQRITLVVPGTTQEELLDALSMPEAQSFKERLVAVAPVLPSSSEELPQIATLLTGRIPPEHGVRGDAPLPEALARMGALADAEAKEQKGLARSFSNPGLPHSAALLFGALSGEGRRCEPDAHTRARTATLEASPLLAALVPEPVLRRAFPLVRCSQRFLSLEELVSEDLDELADVLQSRGSVDAWIYFRPHPHDGWQGLEDDWQETPTPVAARGQHAHRLAGAMQVLADTVQGWGLWQSTDVWILGLGAGGTTLGAFSIHSGSPDRHSALKSLSGVLTSQTELARLVLGDFSITGTRTEALAKESDLVGYTETPLAWKGPDKEKMQGEVSKGESENDPPVALDVEGIPRLRADWQRTALARATRGALCRVERPSTTGAKTTETHLVSLQQSRGAAMGTALEPRSLGALESHAPQEKSLEDCLKKTRVKLVNVWNDDLDLPPLRWDIALRQASIGRTALEAGAITDPASGAIVSPSPSPNDSPAEKSVRENRP